MKVNFSRHMLAKYSSIKFRENLPSGSREVPCGQTDSHDEDNFRFSQFCERSPKQCILLTFYLHVAYNSHNKQPLFPYTALANHNRSTVCSLYSTKTVFTIYHITYSVMISGFKCVTGIRIDGLSAQCCRIVGRHVRHWTMGRASSSHQS